MEPAQALRRLFLVRHAAPKVHEDVPPGDWRITEAGRSDAFALGRSLRLRGARAVFSSSEEKARETAGAIASAQGLATEVEADLGEIGFYSGFLGSRAFQLRVGAYLDGADDPAFENRDTASRRIGCCVTRLLSREDGDVVVVSHGRILTVLLSDLLGRRFGAREWRSIAMPDLTVVDIERRVAIDGFAAKWGARP